MAENAIRNARFTAEFADGTYDFCMNYGAIRMLQESRDMGPLFIFGLLESGAWRVEDIREIIRCGLIGGGMAPARAVKLVQMYVEERPPMENMALAKRVLGAGLIGAPEEGLGESEAASPPSGETDSTISPTVN
jgi:hypothetical protein